MKNFTTPEMEDFSYKNLESIKASLLLLLREIESAEKSLPESYRRSLTQGFSYSDEVKRFEVNLIRYALIQTQGRQRRAAQILGIKLSTLNAKIKRYGIDALNLGTFSTNRTYKV